MTSRIPAQLTLHPFDSPLPSGVAKPFKERRGQIPKNAPVIGERLLRRSEVQEETGLSRSALYRLIAANEFPSQVRLTAHSVAWLRSEVGLWIADRVMASRKPAAKPSGKAGS